MAFDLWSRAGDGGRVVLKRQSKGRAAYGTPFFLNPSPPLRSLQHGLQGLNSIYDDQPLGDVVNQSVPAALITGASGGIGYELAKLFAKDHHSLVLVARNGPRLKQVGDELQRQFGITVRTIALDLAAPTAPQALFEELRREGVDVDILVNNAGYGKFGEFAEVAIEESAGQVQLNIAALTSLTRLFLAPMLERGSGKIMNVASTAGFQPGPLMAVYYATKAYEISFSEALANELADKGITVTCLCPGATETGFAGGAGDDQARLFKQLRPMEAEAGASGRGGPAGGGRGRPGRGGGRGGRAPGGGVARGGGPAAGRAPGGGPAGRDRARAEGTRRRRA